MKKVSVIVPCYNSESYIKRCMDSLLNQTLKDIEILLINDGSTDNTLKVLKDYEKNNKDKVKVVNIPKNKGLGNARNEGIKNSTGEYIGFVDSDDYVDEDMFETMYELAIKDSSEIVECDFVWEWPEKNVIDTGSNYDIKNMIIDVRVMACNKIYKSSWLKKIDPHFAIGLKYEDILFTYEYVPYVNKISFIRKPFYHYIQRSNSLANHQTKRVADMYQILNQVTEYYDSKKLTKKYEKELEYLHIRYLLGSSYKRACKIENKKDRKEVLEEGWKLLNTKYPNWKKNHYLNTLPGLKNKYFKLINGFTYKFNSIIFRIGK